MIISPEICEALCEQAQVELDNVQKYMQVASFFDDLKLNNIAKKFYDQADEEYSHYLKIVKYINSRLGGKFVPYKRESKLFDEISLKNVAQLYLQTEVETTESLEGISDLIHSSNSFIDFDFIDEMLKFQVIEEDEADEFVKKMGMVQDIVLWDASLG